METADARRQAEEKARLQARKQFLSRKGSKLAQAAPCVLMSACAVLCMLSTRTTLHSRSFLWILVLFIWTLVMT